MTLSFDMPRISYICMFVNILFDVGSGELNSSALNVAVN